MAVHRGMKVELPESSNVEFSEETPLSVSVKVSHNGDAVIYLNQEQLTLDELQNTLRIQSTDMVDEKEVLLFADKGVSYQQLYEVLDRISGAGITAISLQAEQKR
jgi:biopolymer transport protein ExbD